MLSVVVEIEQTLKLNVVYLDFKQFVRMAKAKDLSRERSMLWIAVINRNNFVPFNHSKVCSDYFVVRLDVFCL